MENLAIFYGGKSAEHDISIITAIGVMKNLNKDKYNIIPIYVDENNAWWELENYLDMNIYSENNLKGLKLASGFFERCLIKKTKFGIKKYKKVDVAINCMHGLNGEDGTLAGLLQLNNIPLVGSSVLASSVGMDKILQKDIFVANGIPCAKYEKLYEQEFIHHEVETINRIEENIHYPMVVKPANLGSSIGINISINREDLIKNIKIALNFDKKVIIEEQILNLREINCSCIGNYACVETSVLEEPKNWKTFLNFDEKYLEENINGSKKQIDITLGDELDERIKSLSKKVFKLLDCSGVVRIDFLLNDKTKEIFVNEINTIPGSYAYYLWSNKYSFPMLLDKLIGLALNEYEYKNAYIYTYKSSVLKNFKYAQKGTKIIK